VEELLEEQTKRLECLLGGYRNAKDNDNNDDDKKLLNLVKDLQECCHQMEELDRLPRRRPLFLTTQEKQRGQLLKEALELIQNPSCTVTDKSFRPTDRESSSEATNFATGGEQSNFFPVTSNAFDDVEDANEVQADASEPYLVRKKMMFTIGPSKRTSKRKRAGLDAKHVFQEQRRSHATGSKNFSWESAGASSSSRQDSDMDEGTTSASGDESSDDDADLLRNTSASTSERPFKKREGIECTDMLMGNNSGEDSSNTEPGMRISLTASVYLQNEAQADAAKAISVVDDSNDDDAAPVNLTASTEESSRTGRRNTYIAENDNNHEIVPQVKLIEKTKAIEEARA